MLLKPWQWPTLLLLLTPVALSIYLLFERPSREALNWAITYLLGFAMLLVAEQIIEQRASGDLLGFAAMSLLFYFKGLFASSASVANRSEPLRKAIY